MSYDQIICFNGKECSYGDPKCRYYDESNGGRCTASKGVRPVEPTTETPITPVQTQVGGARNINTLREGETGNKENPIKLKGTLVFDPIQKSVDTSRGPSDVTSIVLKDDSGECKISFWGKAGNEVMQFKKGDLLFFEGLYKVKSPYDGKPQVDGGKYYKVAKLN